MKITGIIFDLIGFRIHKEGCMFYLFGVAFRCTEHRFHLFRFDRNKPYIEIEILGWRLLKKLKINQIPDDHPLLRMMPIDVEKIWGIEAGKIYVMQIKDWGRLPKDRQERYRSSLAKIKQHYHIDIIIMDDAATFVSMPEGYEVVKTKESG